MLRLIGATVLCFGLACWGLLFLLAALAPRLPEGSIPPALADADPCGFLFFATACVLLGLALVSLSLGRKK